MASAEALGHAAAILGVSPDALQTALCTKQLVVGDKVIVQQQKLLTQAAECPGQVGV